MPENDMPDGAETTTSAKIAATASPVFEGFVIAIGASAGGLEALERFFKHCPADSGASFVVIQHLSPDHKSMMHDLLARHTRMPVTVVDNDMSLQPNRVYLIPPGTLMRVEAGRFQLTPKAPHLLTLPIDIFLTSLAQEQGDKAIGVVLSGTGSDGTRGAAAVNAAGGFLLAQEPHDARFDGMPCSVIATGLVDAILPADQLAGRAMAHIHNLPLEPVAPSQRGAVDSTRVGLTVNPLEGVLQLLLESGGIDFHDYKPATVQRRIERRMQVRHMRTLADYLQVLEQDRGELATLRRELLIPVTSFFRDPDVFAALQDEVVTQLVSQASAGEPIRVWVAGCSTGEEAYSIAMLFLEAFEAQKRWPNLKIFATDVNQQNVDIAAAGLYPDSAAAELRADRLERFFERTDAGYAVKPELRQCIVFARHNLLLDPPFTRMSLVSCRNTLIYFTAEAQRRALNRLQYAIKPDGYLLLGSSESLAGQSAGFTPINSKHKLFCRTGNTSRVSFTTEDSVRGSYAGSLKGRRSTADSRAPEEAFHVEEAVQLLLSDYVPPTMLVNERHEVIHMFGDVSPFFKGRAGVASLELHRLLPDNIVPVASALLFKSRKDRERTVSDWLLLNDNTQDDLAVRLVARPLRAMGDQQLTLLSFQTQVQSPGQAPVVVNVDEETTARLDLLERELRATRESLQATIEELETSNEELQATNEELMASNEELQSSNEELQSVNEELNTVNAEFQEKVGILNRVNADLDTMTKAVGVATVFVDDQMRLTRFSPDAVNIFKLRDTDIGRPLDDIAHVLRYPGLIDDMRMTLATSRVFEREAQSPQGQDFLVRMLPYGVPSSNARGVLASFVDITAFHDRQRLQGVLDALPEHVAVLEADGTIAMVNAAWVRFAKANGDPDLRYSGVGTNYLGVCGTGLESEPHQDGGAERARRGIKAVLEGSSNSFSMQYPCHSPTEQRWFVMNVAPIRGPYHAAVVSHFNISAWYAQEQADLDASI